MRKERFERTKCTVALFFVLTVFMLLMCSQAIWAGDDSRGTNDQWLIQKANQKTKTIVFEKKIVVLEKGASSRNSDAAMDETAKTDPVASPTPDIFPSVTPLDAACEIDSTATAVPIDDLLPAESISSDPATSGLVEMDDQGALDELPQKPTLPVQKTGAATQTDAKFPAGTVPLKLAADVDDEAQESDENGNVYERSKSVSTSSRPNLTPYQPSGWGGRIVVSNQAGTHTETTVYAGQKAYIDYAYINNGTVDIAQRFYSEFYVNGSRVRRSYKDGLAVNSYGYKSDFEYTFPSAGTYTLKLAVDVDADVQESNENDNVYERSKSLSASSMPNLTPYQPSGWDGKIVVSNQAGTHTETIVYAGQKAYIDYAYINNGTADIGQRFYSEFYVNGSQVRRSYKDGLAANFYAYKNDFEYTFPSAGTYTLKLAVDVDGDVQESNENDNVYELSKNVSSSSRPNITPYQPSGWGDKIVVSNQTGTHTETTVYAGQTAYIDYAYINNGKADILQRFDSVFYINGSQVRRSYIDGLVENSYAYKNDFEYIFPSAGTYTLKLAVDVEDDVQESNENDNVYERSKSVSASSMPNITPYQPSGWDGKIVVSYQAGTHTETTVYAGQKAYIDYAYINNGTEDIAQRFYSEFYVNGSQVRRSYKDGLAANSYGYKDDFEYTFPSAGTYTLKLAVDVEDDVQESNENDNGYERNKALGGGSPAISIQPTSLAFTQDSEPANPKGGKKDVLSACWVSFGQDNKEASSSDHSIEISEENESGVLLKLLTKGMRVEKTADQGAVYDVVHVGKYNGELPPGQPNLPTVRKFIYVPKGKSVAIEVNVGEFLTFTDYTIYPVQLPQPDTFGAEAPPFVQDQEVYARDEWLPKRMVSLGAVEVMRGHQIQQISICPFQYNPAKRILRVYPEITTKMTFNGQMDWMDSRLRSVVFDEFVKGFVVNPDNFDNEALPADAYAGENYLIITAPGFESQANALAAHKEALGISTGVVTTAVTGATSNQIKSYIQNMYDTYSPPPTYVLLLGDVETIPTNYTVHTLNNEEFHVGTDLYYSTVDGSDFVPDLFLGRISVDSASEAQTVINKIIEYESNPPSLSSFYRNAVVAAYFQDGTPYPGTPDGYADRRFVRTAEEVRDFLMGEGYSVQRIYYAEPGATPKNYNLGKYGNGEPLPSSLLRSNGFAWDGDGTDISNAIRSGVFLLLHRDHGMDRNEGYSHTGWGDPRFVETHIDALDNGDLLPVVLSINCQTGWFDGETDHYPSRNHESFCELFLRKSGGGAVGLFGATRSSFSGHNDFMAEGMIDCVWPDFLPDIPNNSGPNARLGAMLNHGRLVMDQLWGDPWSLRQLSYELFHVFGDPSLKMRTSGGGGDESSFTISNLGSAALQISSMAKRDGDPWLSWTPSAPFTIPAGGATAIAVNIDWTKVSGSSEEEKIIVSSNDGAKNPYPDAVIVNAIKNGVSEGPYVTVSPASITSTDPVDFKFEVYVPGGLQELTWITATYNNIDIVAPLAPFAKIIDDFRFEVFLPNLIFPANTWAEIVFGVGTASASATATCIVNIPSKSASAAPTGASASDGTAAATSRDEQ